uniref:Chromo domain-containing protein n=1 Tax=Peronospora matthiolae TaxID=2874970 RepID=A0AAV1UJE0_9STRA
MRMHPKFYVGRLPPNYQYEPVSRGEQHLRGREPRPSSSGPVSTSQSGRLSKRPAQAVERCPDELQSARRKENESNLRSQVVRAKTRHDRPNDRAPMNCNYPLQDHGASNAESVHEPGHRVTVPLYGSAPEHQKDSTLEPDQVVPPPPHPLVDSAGDQRFLVRRILNHRDVNGVRTSYLVRWRGYPPAWDRWVDVLGLVKQYDETDPLRSKNGRKQDLPEREYRDCKVSFLSAISEEMRSLQ